MRSPSFWIRYFNRHTRSSGGFTAVLFHCNAVTPSSSFPPFPPFAPGRPLEVARRAFLWWTTLEDVARIGGFSPTRFRHPKALLGSILRGVHGNGGNGGSRRQDPLRQMEDVARSPVQYLSA